MALARLTGGPLDGQVIPLDSASSSGDAEESIIVPYGQGQLVYHRVGALAHTGEGDGPSEATYAYAEATEDIDPHQDGRDE